MWSFAIITIKSSFKGKVSIEAESFDVKDLEMTLDFVVKGFITESVAFVCFSWKNTLI
jgi:hypothetical protein